MDYMITQDSIVVKADMFNVIVVGIGSPGFADLKQYLSMTDKLDFDDDPL